LYIFEIYKKDGKMDFECLDIENVDGFEWDSANIYKNEKKHGIHWSKIEEIFFNEPLLIYEDFKHSEDECRCYALGKTDDETLLFVVFTVRNNKIRVISARKMNKKERKIYYEKHS
jgi:uncharacterized DUF497 family protein